jgi:hypothetical protein
VIIEMCRGFKERLRAGSSAWVSICGGEDILYFFSPSG